MKNRLEGLAGMVKHGQRDGIVYRKSVLAMKKKIPA